MRTAELLDALERHYLKPDVLPGGIFVREVGQNGGRGSGQRCDAIYVGFTSTSGRMLVGHEVKVSRSDWLHELAEDGKADKWADACHQWYVVAPSTDIVKPDEVPNGWGLLTPQARGRRFKTVKPAGLLRLTDDPPWWAVRSVMARYDTLRAEAIHKDREKHRQELNRRVSAEISKRPPTSLTPEQRDGLEALRALEERLGVEVARYSRGPDTIRPETLAAAIRLVEAMESARDWQVSHAAQTAEHAGKVLTQVAAELKTIRSELGMDTGI